MRRVILLQYTIPLLITLNLISCSSIGAPGLTSVPSSTQVATYNDPFAYCAAVGTIDEPDARYAGPKVPEVIARGLMEATKASPDAPVDMFINNSFWCCMDGKVYGCFVGANIPCWSKANTDRTPTAEETDFSKANPDAEFIPAVVTGHETIYEWRCKNGVPEIARQVLKVDSRGFISAFGAIPSSPWGRRGILAGSRPETAISVHQGYLLRELDRVQVEIEVLQGDLRFDKVLNLHKRGGSWRVGQLGEVENG